jgi:hypothetical protein
MSNAPASNMETVGKPFERIYSMFSLQLKILLSALVTKITLISHRASKEAHRRSGYAPWLE